MWSPGKKGEEEQVGKRRGKEGEEGRSGKGGHHCSTLPAEGNLLSYVATTVYLELIFKNI